MATTSTSKKTRRVTGPVDLAAPVDPDYPLARVPASARRGGLAVGIVIAGFAFFTPTMVTGGQVAAQTGFGRFLVMAAVASLVLATYIGLVAVVSARTGLSTVLVARLTLGRIGGKGASLLLGGTQVGWYGITVGVLATVLGTTLGWETTWPIAVVGGVVMAVTAYYGFRGIELLSWISVPLMLALCLWVMSSSLDEAGGWGGLFQTTGTGGLSTGTALTLMIGSFISGGTQVGNWTRFTRGGRAAFASTFSTFLVVQLAMLFFGGIGAAAYGISDFSELLLATGVVGAGVLLLVANLWTTNDNTAYAFGVAGAELFDRPDKRPFVAGGVVIGITLAVSGTAGSLIGFLLVLGVLVPPLGGAMIGTFFLVWRGRDPGTALTEIPLVRWSGVGAYLAGVLAAGAGTLLGFGVPAVQGIVVSAVAAPLLALAARSKASAR